MPIKISRGQVIVGVAQLINKLDGMPFNKNDENLFEVSTVCHGFHNITLSCAVRWVVLEYDTCWRSLNLWFSYSKRLQSSDRKIVNMLANSLLFSAQLLLWIHLAVYLNWLLTGCVHGQQQLKMVLMMKSWCHTRSLRVGISSFRLLWLSGTATLAFCREICYTCVGISLHIM